MSYKKQNRNGASPPIGKEDSALVERWTRNTGEHRKKGAGAPAGNQNRRTRAIYVASFLGDDEVELFESILVRLHDDFVFNRSSDLMQVELVGVYFLRLARAQALGDYDAAQKLDTMIRAHLKELKTTKLAREGDQPKKPDSSPAEWATKVLEKAKRARKMAVAAATGLVDPASAEVGSDDHWEAVDEEQDAAESAVEKPDPDEVEGE